MRASWIRVAALYLPVAAAAASAFADPATEPAAVVQQFYEKYVKLSPPGLPTAAQQNELAPYLSRRLIGLLDAARAYQQKEEKAHPDEKPPFVDGCLFASLFEGPKSFKVGTTVAEGAGSKVKVHFTADEGVNWDDEVVLVKEDGRYAIDDVLLSGIGAFNPPGRLSTNLESRGE